MPTLKNHADAAGALALGLLRSALIRGMPHSDHQTMSVSKKTKPKSAKSSVLATKSATSKPAAKKKTVAVPTRRPGKKTPLPAAAAALKPVATKPVLTMICAHVDVGFGNFLSIRGEGSGLSWEAGAAMDCDEAGLWRIALPESARGHTFKFLVNDISWSTGTDYTVASGKSITLAPEF